MALQVNLIYHIILEILSISFSGIANTFRLGIEIVAKEARFGKSPETMILNVNGDYTKQELSEMSL